MSSVCFFSDPPSSINKQLDCRHRLKRSKPGSTLVCLADAEGGMIDLTCDPASHVTARLRAFRSLMTVRVLVSGESCSACGFPARNLGNPCVPEPYENMYSVVTLPLVQLSRSLAFFCGVGKCIATTSVCSCVCKPHIDRGTGRSARKDVRGL